MSQHGPQPDPDPLPLEVEQQIDRLSDEFERAWKTGQPPRIEDYLDRVPEAGRAPLLPRITRRRVRVAAAIRRYAGRGVVPQAILRLRGGGGRGIGRARTS